MCILVSLNIVPLVRRYEIKPGGIHRHAELLKDVYRSQNVRSRGQTIAWSVLSRIHSPSSSVPTSQAVLPLRGHPYSRALALFELPKCTRAAMALIDRVVSFLSRAAI